MKNIFFKLIAIASLSLSLNAQDTIEIEAPEFFNSGKFLSEQDRNNMKEKYIDLVTREAIINHYKNVISSYPGDGKIAQVKEFYEIYSITKIEIGTLLPVYEIQFSKNIFNNHRDFEKIIDKEYIQVDNRLIRENPILDFEEKESSEKFTFYRLINFKHLYEKCKQVESCIKFNLDSINKIDNMDYRKVRF